MTNEQFDEFWALLKDTMINGTPEAARELLQSQFHVLQAKAQIPNPEKPRKTLVYTESLGEIEREIHYRYPGITVRYPAGQFTLYHAQNQAWQHLLNHPPDEVRGYLPLLKRLFPNNHELSNPWRSNHFYPGFGGNGRFEWYMLLQPLDKLHAKAKELAQTPVRTFDPQTWFSTSNKYRTIARLPEGMTASEAFEKFEPERLEQLLVENEQRFHSTLNYNWLRMYAERHGCSETLTPQEFKQFKANGGRLG